MRECTVGIVAVVISEFSADKYLKPKCRAKNTSNKMFLTGLFNVAVKNFALPQIAAQERVGPIKIGNVRPELFS